MNRGTRVTAVWIAATTAVLAFAAPAASATDAAPPVSTGCGSQPPVAPGTTADQRISSGNIARTYRLHVPAQYRSERPFAVVLSFHGRTRTAEYQERLSELSGTGVIAVYPQGVTGPDGEPSWQGAPYSADVDDVRFVGDLLDRLEQQLCVDRGRIYATGKSNGGGFTGVLACRMSDRIAAFAPVAGAFYPQGGPCHPSRPVPILEFHGTADATVRYNGDPVKELPPIPVWLSGWAERNGCAGAPESRDLGDGVVHSRWTDCDRNAAVEHYRLEGLGHDWPSTSPNPDSDVPAAIDATPLILRFFDRHRL